MKKTCFWILAIIFFGLLTGCSTTPQRPDAAEQTVDHHSQWLARRLFEQYQEWRGTRYQSGGLSKKGIDCSGFVYLTFKDHLGVVLPRSSTAQVNVGVNIARPELRTGDLVFFRTGRTMRHVGIYLNNDQFLHASTRKGVMISDLNEKYWSQAWWTARRILADPTAGISRFPAMTGLCLSRST